MRLDDASNMHGIGIYRTFVRTYPKEKLHLKDIYADRRTQTK